MSRFRSEVFIILAALALMSTISLPHSPPKSNKNKQIKTAPDLQVISAPRRTMKLGQIKVQPRRSHEESEKGGWDGAEADHEQ